MEHGERRQFIQEYFQNHELHVNPDNLYKPRDSDIILVGPMKGGTTWLTQIVHQLRTKGDESFSDIYDITWLMLHPTKQYDFNLNKEQVCNPRIYKHHEQYGVIETTDKQKTIVIIRDPYDIAYSVSKFVGGFYGDDNDLTDDETIGFFNHFHNVNVSPNFKTMSSWWAHRNDPNVLLLFYEDLKHDLETMIKKISVFLEIPLTDEELRRVCYLCSFEYMAKHKEQFKGDIVIELMAAFVGIEKWKPKIGMVRPDGGKVGEGSNKLQPKLRAYVDQMWNETMRKDHGIASYQDLYMQNGLFAKK